MIYFGPNPPKRPKREGTRIHYHVKIVRERLFDEAMESIKTMTTGNSSPISFVSVFDLVTENRKAPSLLDLSLKSLANYSDSISSLYFVPDHLRKKISDLVSDQGRVDLRFMKILIKDSPFEISVRNCVSLVENDMVQILCGIDRVSLRVLNLGLCGRSMTESAVLVFLDRFPSGFGSLTTLCLQGAFSLTDKALLLLTMSSINLRFIDLSCCSLLTYRALKTLADRFEYTLRGLNIEGCQGIVVDSHYAFKKFRVLNYLSVLGLESISAGSVVEFLTYRGSNLTDFSLGSCNYSGVIGRIGTYCQKLETLDISGSDGLPDSSLGDIADGCSDKAIAAFLEVSGGSLTQLCLNNVWDVSDEFLEELSRSRVHIIGLKMTPVFAHPDYSFPNVDSNLVMFTSSTTTKFLAISLSILAVLSPLYIDRLSEEDLEHEEELFGFVFSLFVLLLLLILAIALSLYSDQSLTRFDPYWIHRLCGSFGGLFVILILLIFVLKCKSICL
ncbi:unnamed protein product [Cochlearia groenlandica]